MVTAIEGRALQSEGNRSVAWSSLRTELVERTLWRMTNVEPSTRHGIEAVRFFAFTLPSSSLDGTLPHVSLCASIIRASQLGLGSNRSRCSSRSKPLEPMQLLKRLELEQLVRRRPQHAVSRTVDVESLPALAHIAADHEIAGAARAMGMTAPHVTEAGENCFGFIGMMN